MTKEEKLADEIWYRIEEYVTAVKGENNAVSPKNIAQKARFLDREIQRAIRSRAK